MGLFIPFVLALALFWLLIGLMIAKFLAQKYKGKPWKSRTVDSQFIYGSALANDRSAGMQSGGYGRAEGALGSGYGRVPGGSFGQFGEGRFKGL